MAHYDVYLHNIPKVEDGKAVPIDPHRTEQFSELEGAQKCAAENKDQFERVVVMRTGDDAQKMIERYMDGEHIVADSDSESE